MSANVLSLAPPRPEEKLPKPVEHFGLWSRWVCQGEIRLDARFYAEDAFQAQVFIEDSSLPIKPLAALVKEMFNLPRFKRVYTDDPSQGIPYLSANEMLMFRIQPKQYLAKGHLPKAGEQHFVQSNWILMTCSGTVGRVVLAGKRLEGIFLTHDLIRIVPGTHPMVGYLYAFLASPLGQSLVTKDRYGSAIKHLEPHHLASIPIPLLPDDEQRAIHEQIMKAYRLRDEANSLLDRAERLLYQELGLPPFDESKVPYMGGLRKPKCFSLWASELAERLDASYHIPITKTIVNLLQKGKYPLARLGDVAERIFIPPRFKRVYVDPEHGVPFLQGSHIPMIKPYDLKHISLSHTSRIERWIIRKDWILVTCSGTIGRVALVSSAWDGWAASQHILRIIPNNAKVHHGYLVTFLMTSYGQLQLTSKVYGGVVDELTEADAANIYVPVPPMEIQKQIGELVIEAFEKKEQANTIEDQAISQLEARLRERRGFS